MRTRRGGFLTTMAILFTLVAAVDLLKAFSKPWTPGPGQPPATGIVFLGVRHIGSDATIMGLLLAAFLLFYAIGIWRMKGYAITTAWIYAAYVILNVTLFAIRNPRPPSPSAMLFAVVYLIVAITLTVTTAIVLTRRRADLS